MSSSWETALLGEVLERILDRRGVTPSKLGSQFISHGHRVISAKHIKTGRIDLDAGEDRFVDEATYSRWMSSSLNEGDVIMTSEAPLGELAYIDRELPWCVGQRLFGLRPRPDALHGRFLFYVLQSPDVVEDIHRRATGTTAQGIRQTELVRVRIPVPPLNEQEGIADTLGALDDKIELNRHTNETLEAMARALFKSWFVDFDPVHEKKAGRTPVGMDAATASLFPDSFQASHDQSFPRSWLARPLYDCATWINGAAYRDFSFSTAQDGLPIVKIAELKAGITAQTKFTVSSPGEKYRIDNGDMLFSWSGNPDTSIDTFVWIHGPAWLNQHIFKVVAPSTEERTLLFSLLRHLRPTFAEIARDKQTTGLGHVTAGDMKRLLVPSPPHPLIRAYHTLVGPILQRVQSRCVQSARLGHLRDALLPKLLSGELRVPEAERIVGKAV